MRLLEEDPDLGGDLDGERVESAMREVRARTLIVLPGEWAQPRWPVSVRAGVGLLVLEGLLLRRVGLEERFGAELLAAGDLLRPWQREDSIASIPRRSAWRVLRRSRIAILDVDFLRRTYPYPEVVGQLVGRALRRSRWLAVNMAIVHQPKVETRVLMLLWHLADRWGTVSAEGVTLPIRLTHAILADLVAAQRPTVSAAIGVLERAGALSRTPEGWRLHGPPAGRVGRGHARRGRCLALVARSAAAAGRRLAVRSVEAERAPVDQAELNGSRERPVEAGRVPPLCADDPFEGVPVEYAVGRQRPRDQSRPGLGHQAVVGATP